MISVKGIENSNINRSLAINSTEAEKVLYDADTDKNMFFGFRDDEWKSTAN